MRNWHDYHLIGYSVNGELQRIEFRLTWPYEKKDVPPYENINMPWKALLVFSRVEGYFFEDDLNHNIIFSIEEIPIEQLLKSYLEIFEVEHKSGGWPLFWKGDLEATTYYLNEKQARVYEISASYGLDGWIVANSVEEFECCFQK